MKYEIPKLKSMNELNEAYCSTGSAATSSNVGYNDCEGGSSAAYLSGGGTICQPTGSGAAVTDSACISGAGDHGNVYTVSCTALGSTPNVCSTGAYR